MSLLQHFIFLASSARPFLVYFVVPRLLRESENEEFLGTLGTKGEFPVSCIFLPVFVRTQISIRRK